MMAFILKTFSALKKTGYAKIALVILILVCSLLAAHAAVAAGTAPVAAGTGGGAAAGITNVAMTAASSILIIHAVLYAIQLFLNALLVLAGALLDLVFNWNVVLVPGNMSVVPLVWGYMRDIANGFFILIVLWIAFTIIFNLESWGGRKLLIRVVAVALLINFSLVFVSTVFGLANAVAMPFRTAMNEGNVSTFIAAKSKIHNIATTISIDAISEIENQARRADTELLAMEGQPAPSPLDESRIANYFGKPQEVHAQGVAGIGIRLGWGALTTAGPRVWQGVRGGFGWLRSVWTRAPEWAKVVGSLALAGGVAVGDYKNVLNLALQDFFLFLLLAAIFPIVIILGLRIVMMIFLAMLAPVAMLLYVIPGKYGEQYWNMWLSALLNWAFLAPAFYLLFYISLLVLRQLNDGLGTLSTNVQGFSENLAALISLIVFLIFLYAAVFVARKMAGAIGETAIGIGKSGLGLALAGVGVMAARGATRALAQPQVRAGMERLGQMPGIRAIGGLVPARARERFLAAEREKVAKHEKDAEHASKQIAINELATLSPHRKVAFLEKVAQEGWMNDAIQTHGEDKIRRWLEMSAQYGKQRQILPSALQLITNENAAMLVPGARDVDDAQTQIMDKFKSDDWAHLNRNVIQNADGSLNTGVLLKIAARLEPENLRRIGRENRQFRDALNQAFEQAAQQGDDVVPQLKPQTYNYILSNAGQQLGYALPAAHGAPQAVELEAGEEFRIEEERRAAERQRKIDDFNNRISDLTTRANRLDQLATQYEQEAARLPAGSAEKRQKEADATRQRSETRRIRDVEIPELTDRRNRI